MRSIPTLLQFQFRAGDWEHKWSLSLPLDNGILSKKNVATGWTAAGGQYMYGDVTRDTKAHEFYKRILIDINTELAYLKLNKQSPLFNVYQDTFFSRGSEVPESIGLVLQDTVKSSDPTEQDVLLYDDRSVQLQIYKVPTFLPA